MTDTIWCDVAEFQKPVDNTYPYRALSIREGDGTYKDAHFTSNYNWCVGNIGKKLDFFLVYVVYEVDSEAWVTNIMNAIGKPNSRMAVMVDVESWGGKISGDHSADINAGVMKLAAWLGSIDRVVGYGNASDLNSIWPTKVLAPNHIVLANYVENAAYPNKFAHQYSDSGNVAPFGSPVDLNSADGYDIPSLLKLFGMTGTAVSTPPVAPVSKPTAAKAPAFPLPSNYYFGAKSGPVQSVSGYYAPYGGPNGSAGLKEFQQQMKNRGNNITVDGLFGPQMATLTANFQKQCKVTVDQKIGPVTWALAWTAPVTSGALV